MAIEKVIHFLWFSDEYDQKTELCLQSWKKNLSGYTIKKWDASNFPYEQFNWTKEAVAKKKWAYATDFFRLWVLYNYGGIYLDADVLVQKSFDDFLDCNMFIGTEFCKQLGAHCIGAEKGHPFIKMCLDFYTDKKFINDNGSLNMIPIPRIMSNLLVKTYSFKQTLANFTTDKIIVNNDINIYPDNFFTLDVKDEKNICVHLGLGSWRDDTTDSNPVYFENLAWYFENRYLFKQSKSFSEKIKSILPFFLVKKIRMHNMKTKNISTIKNIYKDIVL